MTGNSIVNDNPCTICGKQRVVYSVAYEKQGNSVVKIEKTKCPDPLCQKRVDKNLKSENDKRHAMMNNKEPRNHWRKNQKQTK